MTIIGVALEKINVEKQSKVSKNITVKNNIGINGVEDQNFAFAGDKKNGLKFKFLFTSNYQPNVGKIELEGSVLYLAKDEAEAGKLKETWKKTNKLPPEVTESILNTALTKCNIQAIKLSDDMSLPAPVTLPRVRRKSQEK